jgi:hypothetical protein
MTGTFPFDPARIAALGRLADQINGQHAPPPLDNPVLIDDDGNVLLPVPGQDDRAIWMPIEAGLTLQWAPCAEQGGLMLGLWPGAAFLQGKLLPIAVFLTPKGLRALITDLQAIDAALGVQSP